VWLVCEQSVTNLWPVLVKLALGFLLKFKTLLKDIAFLSLYVSKTLSNDTKLANTPSTPITANGATWKENKTTGQFSAKKHIRNGVLCGVFWCFFDVPRCVCGEFVGFSSVYYAVLDQKTSEIVTKLSTLHIHPPPPSLLMSRDLICGSSLLRNDAISLKSSFWWHTVLAAVAGGCDDSRRFHEGCSDSDGCSMVPSGKWWQVTNGDSDGAVVRCELWVCVCDAVHVF
jgi:hypothetical protein